MTKVRDRDVHQLVSSIQNESGSEEHRGALRLQRLAGRELMPSRRRWIEGYVKIEDGESGQLVPFEFNRVQRTIEAWRLRCERQRVPQRAVILKSRHHGVSTLFVGYGQEEVLRNTSESVYRAGIMAQEDATARELLENGKLMRSHLPWVLPTKYDNRSVLWYGDPINGFVDVLSAGSRYTGRGKHYRFLHLTELAFYQDPERAFVALSQTVPRQPDTLLSIETTANGAGGWFYDFFWESWKGKSGFQAMFFPWTWDPRLRIALERGDEEQLFDTLDERERDLLDADVSLEQLKWRRWAIPALCGGSLELFCQEYPFTPREAFVTSGRTVFPSSLALRAKNDAAEPSFRGDVILRDARPANLSFVLAEDPRGPLQVWAPPREGVEYCAGSDSSEGVGEDDCTIAVVEVETGCQVAEYRDNRIRPDEFGRVCVALCSHYNQAYWLPEINPPGNATLQAGVDLRYPRILRQPVFGRAGAVVESRLGWRTQVTSKALMVGEIRLALTEDHRQISSEELADQLLAYQVDQKGSYGAPRGAHDDLVMSWGLALVARKMCFEDTSGQRSADPDRRTNLDGLARRHWEDWERSVEEGDDDERDLDDELDLS